MLARPAGKRAAGSRYLRYALALPVAYDRPGGSPHRAPTGRRIATWLIAPRRQHDAQCRACRGGGSDNPQWVAIDGYTKEATGKVFMAGVIPSITRCYAVRFHEPIDDGRQSKGRRASRERKQ
jgi:hypothetical protein